MRLLLLLVMAWPVLSQQRNFVACPVVRDTKTVPCFLAEYQGETYFLGIQQDITADFYPPQLLHEVLVEGAIAGPRVCGGIPLKPLHVSVLPELNRACNTILPAEPGIDAPPAKRPAGPSTRQAPVSTAAVPPKKPEPPFLEREFVIQYDFDSDFLFARDTRQLTDIAEYARVSKAQTIEVTGYRGSTLLSKGQVLIEKSEVSRLRAERVAEVLKGLGIPPSAVRWISEAAAANGATDYESRRVAVRVVPTSISGKTSSQENTP
jgi:outer membrane protein OmpA-like peptidoglycan-associated protein